MRHSWILGLFGISLYFIAQYARGALWFQQPHIEVVHHAEAPVQVARSGGDEFRWSGSIGRGRVIEVKGVNGNVVAERARGREVEIFADKQSRRSDVSSVSVAMIEHSGGITFCAIYPSRGREANVCAPGDGGHLGSNRNDVKVNFTVRVPDGVTFVGSTVNGNVRAQELESDVRARTVNGSIEVSTTGAAEAHTMNGSITAAIADASAFGGVEFKTMNGTIRLTLPEDISAEFSGGTMNGSISSEFPITISGKQGPRRLSGIIGNGGEMIHVESMNGSIRISRGN